MRATECTLVPDLPDAVRSNAGWDIASGGHGWLRDILFRLHDSGIRIGLFLEADVNQMPRVHTLGAWLRMADLPGSAGGAAEGQEEKD